MLDEPRLFFSESVWPLGYRVGTHDSVKRVKEAYHSSGVITDDDHGFVQHL